jgi:hypothetical protein
VGAHKLQLLAHGLADEKAEHAYQVISGLCDGIAKMTTRLDAFTRREAERQRQARADVRKAIEDSLPDPDNSDLPVGAYPEPPLEPSLRDPDEPQEDGYHYPDGPETQMPGKPAELPRDAPRQDEFEPDPDLPEGMGVAGIPGLGTLPKDPENLAHPQPSKQTPFAVGGP